MSKVWFTADTHFGHANIIRYCNRPFFNSDEERLASEDPRGNWRLSKETIQRHDQGILEAINSRVQQDDILWILGDFCWGKLEEASHFRNRIVCRDVRLVWGNHDHRSISDVFQRTIEQGMVKVGGQKIWLNHYPMRYWDKSFHGSWHLYGHVHNGLYEEDMKESWRLAKDVGVDACGYLPICVDQLAEYMRPREALFEERKLAGLVH